MSYSKVYPAMHLSFHVRISASFTYIFYLIFIFVQVEGASRIHSTIGTSGNVGIESFEIIIFNFKQILQA